MLPNWVVIVAAFGYIGLLFAIASYGDRVSGKPRGRAGVLIYPLSLAIYCTSWTFFGSVGLASRTSIEFLAIYAGPVLMVGLCTPLLMRVVRLAKTHNITSIADFIAARYGKSQAVAATVAIIALIGSVPYIALQLKAVASSLETVLGAGQLPASTVQPVIGDVALIVTFAMAMFAVLFGTRHADATEHQNGLILAIATESLVKLFAFLAAGLFVTFWMFGPAELLQRAAESVEAKRVMDYSPSWGNFAVMTLLSFFAIVLLPRQFHVSVVESSSEIEVRRARWLFPIYLIAINLFVIPIALAGLITFPMGGVDSDMFVLALPLAGGSPLLTVAVFIGGLSAATAMVIVECVALAIMVSNHIVMPLVLQRSTASPADSQNVAQPVAEDQAYRDLRHSAARLFLLSPVRRRAARLDRPALVRGRRAVRARLLRRPVLAPWHRGRRARRHDRRLPGLGLHAVPAELCRRRVDRRRDAAIRVRSASPR